MLDPGELAARLAGVRERIARAAGRVERDPSSVRLVAISKTFSAADIRSAAAAGQIDFGENKVQEALGKMAETSDLPLRWHLVGHLQSNKAKKAGGAFDAVHSVDNAELARALDQAAERAGRRLEILIQVDLANEPTKHGVPVDNLLPVAEAVAQLHSARLTGLMLLPPAVATPEEARPYFAAVRALRDDLIRKGIPAEHLQDLSMGMSHDFEVAIEEGATIVRVGSAIFAKRPAA